MSSCTFEIAFQCVTINWQVIKPLSSDLRRLVDIYIMNASPAYWSHLQKCQAEAMISLKKLHHQRPWACWQKYTAEGLWWMILYTLTHLLPPFSIPISSKKASSTLAEKSTMDWPMPRMSQAMLPSQPSLGAAGHATASLALWFCRHMLSAKQPYALLTWSSEQQISMSSLLITSWLPADVCWPTL